MSIFNRLVSGRKRDGGQAAHRSRQSRLELLESRSLLAGVGLPASAGEAAVLEDVGPASGQNPVDPHDVNGDSTVSPLDVLSVVNMLNEFGAQPVGSSAGDDQYRDVNGDGYISSADALAVINALNAPRHEESLIPGTGKPEPARESNNQSTLEVLAKRDSSDEVVWKISLTGDSPAHGEVEYKRELEHGAVEQELVIGIENAATDSYDVFVRGLLVGRLEVDGGGEGELRLSTDNDGGARSWPVELGVLGPGDLIRVGTDLWGSVPDGGSLPDEVHSDAPASEEEESDDEDLDTPVWGSAAHLTLSFASDGVDVAGHANALAATLDSVTETSVWRAAILAAFQTWSQHANINVGVVEDGGQPFGVGGATQGDRRFGDVRVGAVPMSTSVLALSVPHDELSSGTWAGDILFNSLGNFESVDDIFSVALHEVGHVLGLEHSRDVNSPMFLHGVSAAITPTADDVARLQRLYGQRNEDSHEDGDGNDILENATKIRSTGSLGGQIPFVLYGDITRPGDVDHFYLPSLSNYEGSITFELRTSGKSLLAPRLTVFNESGEELGVAESRNPAGDVVSLTIQEALDGEEYFVRVEAARNAEFDIGSFALIATFDENLTVGRAEIDVLAQGGFEFLRQQELQDLSLDDEPLFFNDDFLLNNSFLTATGLKTAAGFAEATRYHTEASLSNSADVDYYRFKSPDGLAGEKHVLTVSLRSLERDGLISAVTIYDANQDALPGAILVNGNGEYVVQVADVPSDAEFFAVVRADSPGASRDTGNYAITISSGNRATIQQTFAQGRLEAATLAQTHTLYVARPQLFHFGLAAFDADRSTSAIVWLNVYDTAGNTVYRVATRPGDTRTSNSVLLAPGQYSMRITVPPVEGLSFAPAFSYRILGAVVSDPISGGFTDPTEEPLYACADSADQFCYPGDVMSQQPYAVVEDSVAAPPPAADPPWVDLGSWYWILDWLGPI